MRAAILLLLCLAAFFALAQEANDEVPEHRAWRANREACASCHPSRTGVPLPESTGIACSRECEACHASLEGHHPVGAPLAADPPATLPLGRRGTVECLSCHDLLEPRQDKAPRRSQSLFDRLFRRADRHPTYYLRVANAGGEMCRTCH